VSSSPIVAERSLYLVPTPGVQVLEPHLRSLHTAVADLSRPLTLERIGAVVCHSAMEALDVQALVIAVHDNGGTYLRGVHATGVPDDVRERICTRSAEAPELVREIDRFLRNSGPGPATVAALPISQGARNLGLFVLGRRDDRPFSADDRSFLDVLTGLCALALERLRLCADRSRVRALLNGQTDRSKAFSRLRVGDLEIDLEEQRITIGSRTATLTPSELRVLTFLAEQPGRPRSRREILQHLWHAEHVGDERACDVHISNLRRKLEVDPSAPRYLVTLRGLGYALETR
jgi:GAF domain-containing protein